MFTARATYHWELNRQPVSFVATSCRFIAAYVVIIFPVVFISWALGFVSVGASLPTSVYIGLQMASAALSVLEVSCTLFTGSFTQLVIIRSHKFKSPL